MTKSLDFGNEGDVNPTQSCRGLFPRVARRTRSPARTRGFQFSLGRSQVIEFEATESQSTSLQTGSSDTVTSPSPLGGLAVRRASGMTIAPQSFGRFNASSTITTLDEFSEAGRRFE